MVNILELGNKYQFVPVLHMGQYAKKWLWLNADSENEYQFVPVLHMGQYAKKWLWLNADSKNEISVSKWLHYNAIITKLPEFCVLCSYICEFGAVADHLTPQHKRYLWPPQMKGYSHTAYIRQSCFNFFYIQWFYVISIIFMSFKVIL